MGRAPFVFVARTGLRICGSLLILSPVAQAADAGGGPLVQPLAGWLLGVLAVLVISLLSRHRPSKIGRQRGKLPINGKS